MVLLRYMILISTFLIIVRSRTTSENKSYCTVPDWFRCSSGRCLSQWFVCDGENDCGDNSDEENCGDLPNEITGCPTGQFQCDDKTCISLDDFCDRKDDCPDKSDEYIGCTKQKKCNDFRCKNGYCVGSQLVCDGFDDCSDFSDETNCGNRTIPPEQCNNEINRFLCDNGRCILLSNNTCNGKDDCGDNSDEHEEGCKISEELCKKGIGCGHYCNKTPKGPACSCPAGHRLMNNQTCEDIDECTENPELCDQRCTNIAGSYYCICEAGYELQEDKKTCKAEGGEALMIFSSKSKIRGLYLESGVNFPIAEDLQHVVGVSIDADYIYWSILKSGAEAIMRSREDGTSPEVIVTAGLGLPEEITIDWLTGNLYFTDNFWKHIGVCKNDGAYCTIIICELVHVPRGLALNPPRGEMFWSDHSEKPRISRAGMNGKDVATVVTENLGWPSGLAIDYPNERLYWIDAKREIVESISLDGFGDRRQVIRTTSSHPFSIGIFENKIYWSDWETNSIQSADKLNGKNRTILIDDTNTIYGIDIFHTVVKRKIPNPCSSQPCSELCLLALNGTYSCACTIDKELNVDQRTCGSTKKQQLHLVIASGDTFVNYYHEMLGKPRMNSSITLKSMKHFAYDPITGSIIANDESSSFMFRFDLWNSKIRQIPGAKSEYLGGMDFDYYGNNIYWSDTRNRRIVIRSLETGEKTSLDFPEVPLDILVLPKHGTMYVVFKSEDNKYSIDRLKMSGESARDRVIEELEGPKISLAHDDEFERIFFSDEGTRRIETISIRGTDRRVFRSGLRAGPVSLAVMDREIFWTLRNSKVLQWTDKQDRVPGEKAVTLDVEEPAEIMGLATAGQTYDGSQHACRTNNAGCSHVCLVSTTQINNTALSGGNICACPTGMTLLNKDDRTCSTWNSTATSESKKCTRCALLC